MKIFFSFLLLIVVAVQVLPLNTIGKPAYEKGMVEEGQKEISESDGEFFLHTSHRLTCASENLVSENSFEIMNTPILPRPISAVDSPPPNEN